MRRGLLIAAAALAGCGGGDKPVAREQPRCPAGPEGTLRTLGEMRKAARAVQGPGEVRRLAREIAAAHPDDWLGREDLLAQLGEQRECRAEAAALAERLRVPHYRQVVGRLKRTHSLRDQLLDDWNHVVTRKLAFAVYSYRAGLDGATGDLQGIVPPRPVKALHRRYLRSLRTLHRRVIRLERSREYEAARRAHASLPGLARAADRAHAALMRATTR